MKVLDRNDCSYELGDKFVWVAPYYSPSARSRGFEIRTHLGIEMRMHFGGVKMAHKAAKEKCKLYGVNRYFDTTFENCRWIALFKEREHAHG